jgi:hypothetical protein
MDPKVLKAAKQRARRENRTMTNYIETVLRRDLDLSAMRGVSVWAPENVRDYELIREPDEPDAHFQARKSLISKILEKAGS